MNTYIGHSLTAAGVVFDIDDFRNPKLDKLTPIQVTKDGRVFGHLAGWKTNHIGHDRPVKPPHSMTGYKFFHQSVVSTTDGDLPVGHLTLGTGHAGSGDAIAAAAHYDNTGTQTAAVRAGEDEHGIWIAGRAHPGTDDMQKQTLRRSSLSGDWRRVTDPETGRPVMNPKTGKPNLELVAALAVNVPGFPIPRTELLVASAGEPTMLVAAGIVRNGPITRAEVEHMVAAAAADAQTRVENEFRRRELMASAQKTMQLIEADAEQKRREMLAASGQELVASIQRDNLRERFESVVVASGRQELLAAPPVEDPLVVEPPPVDEAPAAPVHTGGMIALVPANPEQFAVESLGNGTAEPADELHVTLAFLGEDLTQTTPEWRQDLQAAVAEVVAETADGANGLDGKVFGRAVFNENSEDREACAVYLIEAQGLGYLREKLLAALGNRVPKSEFDTYVPHLTAGYGLDVESLIPNVGQPIQFDRVRVAIAGEQIDLTIGEHAPEAVTGEFTGNEQQPAVAAAGKPDDDKEIGEQFADTVIEQSTPTGEPPARTAGEPGTPLLETEIPATGAEGGTLVEFVDGVARYDDGTETDGQKWSKTAAMVPA